MGRPVEALAPLVGCTSTVDDALAWPSSGAGVDARGAGRPNGRIASELDEVAVATGSSAASPIDNARGCTGKGRC